MVLAAVNFDVIGGEICFSRTFNDTGNKFARSAKITFAYMRLCGQGGAKTR
jgi:hypothetical protein